MVRLILALFPELQELIAKFNKLRLYIRFLLVTALLIIGVAIYFLLKGVETISPTFSIIILILLSVSLTVFFIKKFYKNYPVCWYIDRESSNEHFSRDMQRSSALVFLGISNSDLKVYLRNSLAIKNANPSLRSIDVYYSSPEDGLRWEGENFIRNVIKSRQEITSELMHDLWYQQIPSFEKINFYQCRHHITYGGAMMGDRNNGDIKWRTIYVVNYLPWSQPDTKTSITFKIDYNIPRKINKELVKRYCDSYQFIHREADRLGSFSPSLWDISVSEWASFCEKCNAHKESMKYLLNFAQLQGNEKVLDLAAGTGHISKIILEQLPQINLTVLDASPRMLESCKKILGDRSRYALCKVPTILRDERLIDLETRRGISKKFDAILIHLALPAVAKCINELRELARWCKTLLVDGGRVFLCAHNTAVKINSSNFDISKDPLRLTLKDVVNRMDFKKGYLRSIDELEYLERCFDQNNIEKAFNDVGYLMEKRDESNFFMTMDDRFAMWRTPAVMDEILDIEQMLADYRDTFNNDAWNNKIIDEVEKRIKNKPTPDMQVIYWAFQYRKTHK